MTPLHVLDVRNRLGEGVLWDGRTHSAVWTDIESSRFWQSGADSQSFPLPQRLGNLWRFDGARGPVGDPEIFATTPSGIHPDGSCIDADDHLWNAQWGGGEIVRYRSDGTGLPETICTVIA
jgi:sugar lactone lactonase YvrE